MRQKFRIVYIALSLALLILTGCDKEVSVTPPYTTPEHGSIYVDSEPKGYSIYVNGRNTGYYTPDSIVYLSSDEYEVSLRHPVYLDTTVNVNVGHNESMNIGVDMTVRQDFYSKLECTSTPAYAEIFLNDSSTGVYTPAVLSGLFPGQYIVSMRKLGYVSSNQNVTLVSNEKPVIYGNLRDTTVWYVYNAENSQFNTNVVSCFHRFDDNIWAGTFGDGVYDMSSYEWRHHTILNSILPDNMVTSVGVAEEGEVIVSTLSGVALYNNSEWSILSTLPANDIAIETPQYSDPNSTTKFYVCTMGGGVMRYAGGNWTALSVNNNLPSQQTTCVDVTSYYTTTEVAVGTYDAGVFVTRNMNVSNSFSIYNMSNTNMISNQVTAVEIVPSTGSFYVGVKISSGMFDPIGMLYYRAANGSWEEINFSFGVVNDILVNFTDTWVATSKGLYKLTQRTLISEVYTKENSPLESDIIYEVYLDRSGILWMSTAKGLARFKP